MENEPDYNQIGQLLKDARKERHMALEYVAQQLHIRTRYLDALESGRLSELPGISYAKGYLKVYAGFVGLDQGEILRRFEDIEEKLGRRGFYLPQVFRKEKTPSRGMVWGGLALAAAVYLLWLMVQPSLLGVSLVEPFTLKEAEIPTVLQNGPCLAAAPALYPPCTIVRQPEFNLVSLQAHTKIDMSPATELAVSK